MAQRIKLYTFRYENVTLKEAASQNSITKTFNKTRICAIIK